MCVCVCVYKHIYIYIYIMAYKSNFELSLLKCMFAYDQTIKDLKIKRKSGPCQWPNFTLMKRAFKLLWCIAKPIRKSREIAA